MSATVVQLSRVFRRSWDWSQQELAEFYRVESALIQAGLKIEIDRGLSDEGDPWFAFCRSDNGDVIVHIARIAGVYFLASPSYEGIASGRNIANLVGDLVSRHPLIQMRGDLRRRGPNILLHPAALLIAVVATAFFKGAEVRAGVEDPKTGEGRNSGSSIRADTASSAEGHKSIVMEAALSAVILSAVAAALQVPQLEPISQEPELETSALPEAELRDLAEFSPPIPHAINGGLATAERATPVFIEALQEQRAHDVEPVDASAHAGLQEAMPLIALLWDFPVQSTAQAEKKTVAEEAGTSVREVIGPMQLHSMLLTFEVAASSDPSDDLPEVQSVKISHTDADGDTETYSVLEPQKLPAALVSVLQAAFHTTIESEAQGLANGSMASTLIHLVTNQATTNKSSFNSVDSSQSELSTSSNIASDVSETEASTSDPPLPAATVAIQTDPPPHKTADVSAAVQEFFEQTSHWKTFNTQTGIVVYDADALTSHPEAMKSVTFDFTDGSTLSLVGLAVALPDWLIV